MVDHILLLGSEEVARAAQTMVQAADTMSSSASTIDYALQQHRQQMDEWMARFEEAVEKMNTKLP